MAAQRATAARKAEERQAAAARKAEEREAAAARKATEKGLMQVALEICSRAGFEYHNCQTMKYVDAYWLLSHPAGQHEGTYDFKKAYRKMALLLHPDKNADKSERLRQVVERAFQALNQAHTTVKARSSG